MDHSSRPNEYSAPLHKIAELEILDRKYDLARNGSFTLVDCSSIDAYGKPTATVIDLWVFLSQDPDRAQALLDLLGEYIVKLQSISDMRRGQIGEEKGEGV